MWHGSDTSKSCLGLLITQNQFILIKGKYEHILDFILFSLFQLICTPVALFYILELVYILKWMKIGMGISPSFGAGYLQIISRTILSLHVFFPMHVTSFFFLSIASSLMLPYEWQMEKTILPNLWVGIILVHELHLLTELLFLTPPFPKVIEKGKTRARDKWIWTY